MKDLDYPILLERDADGWWATHPDLLGCSGGGDTPEEAITVLNKSRAALHAGMKAEGIEVPAPGAATPGEERAAVVRMLREMAQGWREETTPEFLAYGALCAGTLQKAAQRIAAGEHLTNLPEKGQQ